MCVCLLLDCSPCPLPPACHHRIGEVFVLASRATKAVQAVFTPNPSAFSCEVVVVSQKRYDDLMEHVASCAMSYSVATTSSPKTSSDGTGGRRQSNASYADDGGDGRTAVSSRLQAASGAGALRFVLALTLFIFVGCCRRRKSFPLMRW